MTNFSNEDIALWLDSLSFLMEVEGSANPFRVRSIRKASEIISSFPRLLSEMSVGEMESISGIGKGIANTIHHLLTSGTSPEWEDVVSRVPETLLELRTVRGLGPARIRKLWREGNIKNLRNLEKTARENPALLDKILGPSVSEKIRKELYFLQSKKGKKLYFQVEPYVKEFLEKVRPVLPDMEPAGELYACEPIVQVLEFYSEFPEKIPAEHRKWLSNMTGLPVIPCSHYIRTKGRVLLGTTDFIDSVKNIFSGPEEGRKTKVINKILQLPPELHDRPWQELQNTDIENLITASDIRGIIHCHTQWSDGKNSIEEMARACLEQGWEWLVISDHSRSSYYANGLSEERVIAQWNEIDQLNQRLKNFRLFYGIECDILKDGRMDYSDDVLKKFDVVIASIHSGFQMTEELATRRLIKAIEHPHVHIIGHLSGRLLLQRDGYPVDHHAVIDACAANGVAIELNVNPYRLDIDKKWIVRCMEKGVMLCISPDAHSVRGLQDVFYGCVVARKGLLRKTSCLNCYSAENFLSWLQKK